MDKDEIKQIIHEEVTKGSFIKEVHLHIHGDEMKAFELLEHMMQIQHALLKTRVLERLGWQKMEHDYKDFDNLDDFIASL